jgi:hypothetical protein
LVKVLLELVFSLLLLLGLALDVLLSLLGIVAQTPLVVLLLALRKVIVRLPVLPMIQFRAMNTAKASLLAIP